jgi:hypothetical protein
MADRLEPLEACTRLLTALGDRAPALTPEQAAQALSDFTFLDCGGAVVMTRGSEIHAAAPRERRGRWIRRSDLRSVLGGIVEKHGFATTSVRDDNAAGHAFVRRMGFAPTGEQRDGATYYKLEIRHAS